MRTSAVVVMGCLVGLVPGIASAQQAQSQTARPRTPPARTPSTASGAPAAGESDPGQFHRDGAIATTNIGSGSGPTREGGPVGELRGDTAPAPDVITGPIGPGDVARIMQAQMPRLRPCYDRARTTRPQLQGRLEVRFTLGRDGRVTQAAAYGMNDAPEVATCVADTLRQTTFPQPQGGSLQFIYPITFQPPPATAARGRTARTPAARH